MGQSVNYAAKKDAQTRLRKGECAGGMGHIAIQIMNRLDRCVKTHDDVAKRGV